MGQSSGGSGANNGLMNLAQPISGGVAGYNTPTSDQTRGIFNPWASTSASTNAFSGASTVGNFTGSKGAQPNWQGVKQDDGTYTAPTDWKIMGSPAGNLISVQDPEGGAWDMNLQNGYMTPAIGMTVEGSTPKLTGYQSGQYQAPTPSAPTNPMSAVGAMPGLTGDFTSLMQTNPLAALNYASMASMTPPGNNPIDAANGTLFQNSASANPAFGVPQLLQMMGYNVPTALASFGTQASPFGSLTGLGNPGLLTLMLLMANRPTTTVPFDPIVQSGSPDDLWGIMGLNGFPFFPPAGSTLPPDLVPPFKPVPPVPGGASNLPGVLPPVGHGPFQPGQGGGGGGEGGGEEGGGSGDGGDGGWSAGTQSGQTTKVKGGKDLPSTMKYAGGQVGGGPVILEVRDPQGNVVYSRSDR